MCNNLLAQRTDIISDTLKNDKAVLKNLLVEKNIITGKISNVHLNPMAVSFVQEYIHKETKEYNRMKIWGRPYFELYDMILQQYNLPKELKYLSVIESSLQSNLVSWAGAVGPWQLMDYEGKRFGLHVKGYTDERTDYYKSTQVAAKLLKELYQQFGDWLLVIAAYNGGAGRVKNAIAKSGSRDFWKLQFLLPEETRNHVKKFIGTHYIFEGDGGITTMTAEETQQYLAVQKTETGLDAATLANTDVKEISGRYLSVVVSNYLLMDISEFNKLNPGFDKKLAEGNKYMLRLPKERMFVFDARKNEILIQSVKLLLEGTTSVKRIN
ncbi:MAG: lytic transglycosylase domain-containing protein [Bacteroidetes bacterium]|nr:lytic transglycosylase domain-containing protein [Bacteroidota bacterium]